MRYSTSLIAVRAPAKINLFLHVLERQPDGHHRIFSLMQMVGLYDQIRFRRTPVRGEISFSATGLSVPRGEDNLMVQAARAFLRYYNIKGGVRIVLHKQIPLSGGLGGGSSDAAATLRALCRLWEVRPSTSEMTALGRSVGSDVPFFLSGPTALVRATGEEIHPLRLIGKGWVVLVNIGARVSTAWAYQKMDEIRSRQGHGHSQWDKKFWLTLVKNRNKIIPRSIVTFQLAKLSPYFHNDLEEVTGRAYPGIGVIRERLRLLGAAGVLMSGSGPTVFGLFLQISLAQRAARALRQEHKDWKVWVVKVLERRPF